MRDFIFEEELRYWVRGKGNFGKYALIRTFYGNTKRIADKLLFRFIKTTTLEEHKSLSSFCHCQGCHLERMKERAPKYDECKFESPFSKEVPRSGVSR